MFGFRFLKPKQFKREIIVNAESLETRVAVLENGKLEEFQVEHPSEERIVGGIYSARYEYAPGQTSGSSIRTGEESPYELAIDLATPENAKQLIDSLFFDFKKYDMGNIARYKLNRRFNLNTASDEAHRVFQVKDFVAILKELVKRHPTRRLNHSPKDVHARRGVRPAASRLEAQRLPGQSPAGFGEREMGLAIGHLPDPAGGRQHVPQGHRARRPGGLAVLVHSQTGEFRQVLRQRVIQGEFAIVGQDRDAHSRDRFRHRGYPEDVIGLHLPVLGDVRLADGAEVDDAIPGGDERHGAGDLTFIDKLLHPRRNGSKAIRLLCEHQAGRDDDTQ